jgi:hypothetical protein
MIYLAAVVMLQPALEAGKWAWKELENPKAPGQVGLKKNLGRT